MTVKTQLLITIETKIKLTEDQKAEILHDFKWRLEGYRTDPLIYLDRAKIAIKLFKDDFWCDQCGSGSDEHPAEHTQDCTKL